MLHPARNALILLLVFLFVAGCAPPAVPAMLPEPSAVEGGILTRAMTSEPAQIDPQEAPSSGLNLILPYLFDTLIARDVDNTIRPFLAEHWEIAPDGTSVTFTLREGITFHDGTPLDAEAVRFTFQRFQEQGTRSPIYGGIQQISGIEAVDERTVRFMFDQPTANIWSTLTMPYAAIISPASARRVTETGEGSLVGSGPFMLEEWLPGQFIRLMRNPDYAWAPPLVDNQEAPYLQELVFRIIPDASTQLAALEAGEVDVIFINQPSHQLKLENNEDVDLQKTVLNSLIYLGFNCQKPPFDEVPVRQALAHAVNKQEIVDLVLGDLGSVAFAPLPSSLPGFDPALQEYELAFDPQKAEERLAAAGFQRTANGGWERDGLALQGRLLTSNRPPNETIATLLQSQFQAIGVPIEIQQLDSKAVMQATGEGQFELLLWRYDWNDPDALNIFLSSDRIGSTNRAGYSNPAVDALLAEGAYELDEDARQALYVEAQKLILQDAPWQPLYTPVDIIAVSRRIQSAKAGYMGRLLLNDARVSQ